MIKDPIAIRRGTNANKMKMKSGNSWKNGIGSHDKYWWVGEWKKYSDKMTGFRIFASVNLRRNKND
ncbi:MAG: hypothetical protein ACTSYF_05095 [Promethearchaeota archaeon]